MPFRQFARLSWVEWLFWLGGVALSVAVGVDILSRYLGSGQRILEGDWCVLGPAIGIVAVSLARPWVGARLGAAALGVAACCAAAELALVALLGPAEKPARADPWFVWPPGHKQEIEPRGLAGLEGRGVFTINEQGLRGRPPADDDGWRILCVGGSTTECFYLDDADAWPHLLEVLLNARGARQRVDNAGRSGLMAPDHGVLLEHLPEAATADVWLVLCGINDLSLQLSGAYAEQAASAWRRTFAYRRPGWSGTLERPYYRNAHLFALCDAGVLRLRRKPSHWVQDPHAAWVGEACRLRAEAPNRDALPDLAGALEEYERQLRRIVRLAGERGKRLVLMTQPSWFRADLPALEESRSWAGALPSGEYLTAGKLAEGLAAFNERMRGVCRSEGVPCIDLAARIEPTRGAFYDGVHFHRRGAARVAAIVYGERAKYLPGLEEEEEKKGP